MDRTQIKEHWEAAGAALDPGAPVTPTSRDPYLAELERGYILAHLSPTDRVLEIGCGIGTHTIRYAEAAGCIIATDLAESLIEVAKAANPAPSVEYHQRSVLDLISFAEETQFDVVVSQRCLINLPTWTDQQEALRQIRSVLKPGGRLLMTEGFSAPLDALNTAREAVGLEPIAVVAYNRNLHESELDAELARHWSIRATGDYGTYLYLSRVLHPLAVAPEQPRHDSPINRAAMQMQRRAPLPGAERYSYNRFLALSLR